MCVTFVPEGGETVGAFRWGDGEVDGIAPDRTYPARSDVSLMLFHLRFEVASFVAGIKLARTCDLKAFAVHLTPVGNPSDRARHRKDDGEHR